MSVMLQTQSRASSGSSSSYQALSRQNTMSSYEGSRSARQSKRYSMSALYMSMSANEGDLQIEDELAKGKVNCPRTLLWSVYAMLINRNSAKGFARPQIEDFISVEEELCPRKRRAIPRLANCSADSKSHGT